MAEQSDKAQGAGGPLRRWLPLLLLLAGLALFFAFGLQDYLTLESLSRYSEDLRAISQLWWAPLAYGLVYAAGILFFPPSGAAMTIAGGYMFGQFFGSFCIVIAATLGATALFLVAKTSIGDALRAKAGPAIQRMEAGFRENELNYLLVLRLIPLFPFWLVNLVPAFLGVRLRTFVLGTFFGIIPGTFVYASVGAGLESVISQGGEISLAGVLTPQVITALVGLAVLALIPVIYKRVKARRAE